MNSENTTTPIKWTDLKAKQDLVHTRELEYAPVYPPNTVMLYAEVLRQPLPPLPPTRVMFITLIPQAFGCTYQFHDGEQAVTLIINGGHFERALAVYHNVDDGIKYHQFDSASQAIKAVIESFSKQPDLEAQLKRLFASALITA